MVQALGESDEGPYRIAKIIGALGKVTVFGEEHFHLAEESALAAEVASFQGFLDEGVISHDHADHPHASRRPGRPVVEVVEHLGVGPVVGEAVHDEIGIGAEEFLFHGFALFLCHAVIDAVVGDRGMDQADTLVEGLPENAPGIAGQPERMEIQRGVEIDIGGKDGLDFVGVFFIAGQLEGDPAVVHVVVVQLVHFVRVSAASVFRGGKADGLLYGVVSLGDEFFDRLVKERDTPFGRLHLPDSFLGQKQVRMLGRHGCAGNEKTQ